MGDTMYANGDATHVRVPDLLRPLRSLLAVVAHPDDESFGLGGVLDALTATGRDVSLLCFSAGEGSTLGASKHLAQARTSELAAAARVLGVGEHWMEGLPDGELAALPDGELSTRILARVEQVDPDALVVLDRSGVTGHPDHRATSAAALAAAAEAGLPVLEWGLPSDVADALAEGFGLEMHGMAPGDELLAFTVNRGRHWEAIKAHVSQGPDNPLLARRLAMLGDKETVRLVRPSLASQLARFVSRVPHWARTDASPDERGLLLDALIGFAVLTDVTSWPADILADDPGSNKCRCSHCLHDDPAGWSLAAVITANGSATPPHDHTGWGAAATVLGAERNTRYVGVCPDGLRTLGQEVVPTGGGYLFGPGDIHQAADAAGRSVSLHLISGGGRHPSQHCPESRTPG